MRQRSQSSSATSRPSGSGQTTEASAGDKEIRTNDNVGSVKRSNFAILALFILVINGSVAVHYYQFESMPRSLTAEEAGERGFAEDVAMKHVRALTALGPHPVGSDALDRALEYVLEASENVKITAHWEVDVEVELFNVKSGANRMVGGLFKGKSLVYSDLTHVLLRISPKYPSEAREKAILVSSHIDTVFSAEGAGDCSSCVAVMLELARGISHWAHGFKSSVIFLFNTGEEEGLNGAHSFITQHPWSSNIQIAIDLEAMGIGGKSIIFQAGPNPWAVENFGMVAKYPSAQIIAQDIFSSGAIKSATDFQVYRELAGLSGLDFVYMDNTAVYHTKNDKLKLYKLGSLQHLGENMLAFLLHAGASPDLAKGEAIKGDGNSGLDTPIYFDILGSYMIVFRRRFSNMLCNSVIMQSLLIWATSLLMGGYPAAISLALSVLSVILMWICSIGFSVSVGFIVPLLSASPVPFVSIPWLVIGLLGAPALLGAFTGQHVGYLILERYLLSTYSKTKGKLSPVTRANLAKLDAERWLFKAGLLQWLVLLMVGNYFKIGSSYIALVWLVSPAFAYGLLEATLSPARLPRPLKTLTLLVGLSIPFLISSGIFILLGNILIGTSVRFDRDPGNTPGWLGSVVLSAYVAAIVCLTLVYLLSYVHISGARKLIVFATCILLGLSLIVISSGVVPPFTEDTSRAVNVVHVVETAERSGGMLEPSSYVSLFSTTPGKLIKEVEEIGEGFVCSREKPVDFVTFLVKYGCSTHKDAKIGWSRSDIPRLLIESDTREGDRITQISVDTKASTRWTLAINTKEIEDFVLEDETKELVPRGDKTSVGGWHIIQFSGGKKSPTKFKLTLFWVKDYTQMTNSKNEKEHLLLRLRTDVDKLTPQTERVLKKLPSWCSLFGKSTSPHTLAFLNNLPVVF